MKYIFTGVLLVVSSMFMSLDVFAAPTLSFSEVQPTCFGNSNGTLFTTVTGGTSPYNYLWSNSKTTRNINLLSDNTYTIITTDAAGEVTVKSPILVEPSAVTLNIASIVPDAPGGPYTVTFTASGGTPGYTYNRTGDAAFYASPVFYIPAGTYIFKAKDANGCQKSILKNINDSTSPDINQNRIITSGTGTPPVITVSESASGDVSFTNTDTISVSLANLPSDNVVLTVASSNPARATVSPSTLTFTPSDWSTPQTVTITGVDNGISEGDGTATLTVSVDDTNSPAVEYDSALDMTETIYIEDADTLAPTAIIAATVSPIATNNPSPTLTGLAGSAEANAVVVIKKDSTILCRTFASGTGSWSCAVSIGTLGSHTLSLTQIDKKGNISSSTSFPLTITNADMDGDGIVNIVDTDTDGDSTPNTTDTDDDTTCGVDTVDIDCDGIVNIIDTDTDGDSTPNTTDTDDDGDGDLDADDTSPTGLGTVTDYDEDGLLNANDPDNDGISDGSDTTPTGSGTVTDYDGDGVPNDNDPDVDGDGTANSLDDDMDGDGILNTVDTDDDDDGILDTSDTNSDYDPFIDSIEDAAPNGGDANNDGTADKSQANVLAVESSVNNNYQVVETPVSCPAITSVNSVAESSLSAQDSQYDYPAGLTNFTAECVSVGDTATITLYYYGDLNIANIQPRKFDGTSYSNVSGAIVTQETISGQSAIKVVYTVVDGGVNDADGIANRVLVDPIGLGVLSSIFTIGTTTVSSGSSGGVLVSTEKPFIYPRICIDPKASNYQPIKAFTRPDATICVYGKKTVTTGLLCSVDTRVKYNLASNTLKQNPVLKKAEIRKVQRHLKRLGILHTPVNGFFGSSTKKALLIFQENNRLRKTGTIDLVTKNALNRSC